MNRKLSLQRRVSFPRGVAVLALLSALQVGNYCDTFVAPAAYENTELPESNDIPLGMEGEFRAQQIYSPSLFPVLEPPFDSFRITGIAFRLNAETTFPGGSIDNFDRIQLFLSTSPKPLDTGYPIGPLDNNHGPDKTLVFDQATTLGGTYPPRGPSPFNVQFTFQNSYEYNPKNGNLVLEIYKYAGGEIENLDCCGANMVFRFENLRGFFGGFPGGNITQFTFEPVPEPGVVSLLGLGVGVCFTKRALSARRGKK